MHERIQDRNIKVGQYAQEKLLIGVNAMVRVLILHAFIRDLMLLLEGAMDCVSKTTASGLLWHTHCHNHLWNSRVSSHCVKHLEYVPRVAIDKSQWVLVA